MLREVESKKNKYYARIEVIFPVYEKRFYKYLDSFVIDDLLKRKDLIRNFSFEFDKSVDNYFEYVFPESTFPHILVMNEHKVINPNQSDYTFRKKIRNEISSYISRKGKRHSIRESFIKGIDGNQIKPNYVKELNELRKDIIKPLIKGVINDLLKDEDKAKKSPSEFKNLAAIKHLHIPKEMNELIEKGYKSYRLNKEQQEKEKELDKKPRIKPPRPRNIKEQIIYQIIPTEKEDEIKTFEDFNDLLDINKYNFPINETFDKLYKFYLKERKEFFNRTNPKQLINISDDIKHNGFKTKNLLFPREHYITNYFPLKQNQKLFSLHTIAPKDSYLIDLMFENRIYCYLVAININTRKLWVEPTNVIRKENDEEINQTIQDNNEKINQTIQEINENEKIDKELKETLIEETVIKQMKNTKLYLAALEVLIHKGMKVKYLKGDGEAAFKSDEAQAFYFDHKINENKRINDSDRNEFIEVKRQTPKYPDFMKDLNMVKKIKSEPSHSSLGIIDRAIRTIRDIAYNLHFDLITPKRMRYIVELYNNTPHDTLSKYAGQEVSPNDVENDESGELEKFIVRRIQQENYNIMSSPLFNLGKGQEVKVYNNRNSMAKRRSQIEPGNYKVIGRKGALFEVIDLETGGKEIKSRYQIAPIFNGY